MTFSMAGKFAFQNLKANRLFETPFVLSSGIMLIMFNIMASLINNEYVQTRHASLPTVIAMGAAVVIQLAGTGDKLQDIKRGIMEMADGIIVNYLQQGAGTPERKTRLHLR